MKMLMATFLLAAMTLAAAELTGKWHGKFDVTNAAGQTEPNEAFMDFKLSGTAVTGTAGPNEGEQWPIKNGKLENGKLTFEVATEDGSIINFDLVFDGETVHGTASGTGQNGEKMSAKVDLKRAS